MDNSSELKQKAERISKQIHKSQIGNKIFDIISNLEQNFQQTQRRWIWELLHNAKEASVNDEVEIKIILGNDFLEFSHTGKPFKTEDIICLIDQTSKKPRFEGNNDHSIRSGTGFAAVYLLSKKVSLKGIWQDGSNKNYKQFSLKLDRNGNRCDMMSKIDKNYEVFAEIENTKTISSYKPGEKFDTVFRFDLDEKGRKVAKTGISELENSGLFTMLFNRKISSIKVSDKVDNIKMTYSFVNSKTLTKNNKECLTMEDFKINDDIKTFLSLSNIENECQLAVEITSKNPEKYYQINKNDQTPMIFVDIPLIGTEDFPFPVVVNCPLFSTNEQKNGLLMKGSSEEVEKNKNIFSSLSQFQMRKFLNFVCGYEKPIYNRHYLANTKIPKDFDEEWYRKHIQQPLRCILYESQIIENCEEKFIKLSKCIIPSAEPKNLIPFHDLLTPIYKERLVKKRKNYMPYWINELTKGWEKTLDESNFVDISSIIDIVDKKRTVNFLMKMLSCDDREIFQWLNKLYSYLSDSLSHKEFLQLLNEKAIIPNQKGDLRRLNDLCEDNYIPSQLKPLLKMIGQDVENICKEKNLNILIEIKDNIDVYWATKTIEKFFHDQSRSYEEKTDVSLEILTIFPEKPNKNMDLLFLKPKFMNTIKVFFPKFKEKDIKIQEPIFTIWKKAETFLTRQIIEIIERHRNLESLANTLKQNENSLFENLGHFYSLLSKSFRISSIINAKIFLSQNKEFHFAKDLINEKEEGVTWIAKKELFNIISKMNSSDNNRKKKDLITLKNNQNKKKEDFEEKKEKKEVAPRNFIKLRSSVENNFQEEVLKDLKEKEIKKGLKNKFLNYKKKDVFEEKKGYEPRFDLISSIRFVNKNETNENFDDNISVSLGDNPEAFHENMVNMNLTSNEQFQDMIEKKSFKIRKNLKQTNQEAFKKVEEYLIKAKNNILECLNSNKKYDTRKAYYDEKAPNHNILMNVKKNNKMMHIVARPVIGNKIMLHNQREVEELEDPLNELWVSDGNEAYQVIDELLQKGKFKVFLPKKKMN